MDSKRPGVTPARVPTSALIVFLPLTFTITWGVIGAYVIAPETAVAAFGAISGSHPAFFIATWSPAIAGFAAVFLYSGAKGVRGLASRVLVWRCPKRWVLFVVFVPPLAFIAGSLIKGGPVLSPAPAGAGLAAMVMMLFLGPVEEFGWRGVMQPILQRLMAPIWAGLLIGATWGLWHLPAFFLAGVAFADWNFLAFFIGNVALAVLVTPLFNRAGGGLAWPMLFHWQLINPFWPDAQPWDTWILVAVAAVVVVWNKNALFSRGLAIVEVVDGKPNRAGP